jgi:DNA-binding NtrC family response regulator
MYRILVVDDEPSICKGLALALLSKEYSVDMAGAGSRAIQKGCREKYDVLIVDLCLPDMHGLEVIRELKEQNPQILAIVITAHRTKESYIEARKWGVRDYFEKPFQMQSIKDAIARGIATRALSGV